MALRPIGARLIWTSLARESSFERYVTSSALGTLLQMSGARAALQQGIALAAARCWLSFDQLVPLNNLKHMPRA